jgi:hypothetical protein
MVTGGSEAAVTIAGMEDLMQCMRYQQMMIQRQLPDPWTKIVMVSVLRRSGSFDSRGI